MMNKYIHFIVHLIVATSISYSFAGSYEDFFAAILRDDRRALHDLLERGFDVNTRDPKGQTGLISALQAGASNAADVLIAEPRLDPDAANEAGETALMMAALKGDLVRCQRLLDRRAKLELAGWTPLHYAATGPESKIVQLFLDRGAAIDPNSPNRTTPLMMAARYGTEASVSLLVARGADFRRRNDQNLSAGDFARLAKRETLGMRLDALAR